MNRRLFGELDVCLINSGFFGWFLIFLLISTAGINKRAVKIGVVRQ
jgi:hypothetical protein